MSLQRREIFIPGPSHCNGLSADDALGVAEELLRAMGRMINPGAVERRVDQLIAHALNFPQNPAAIRNSGNLDLIARVEIHLGPQYLNWTKDQIVHFVDGGPYGMSPDPRTIASQKITGELTSILPAIGSSGPQPGRSRP